MSRFFRHFRWFLQDPAPRNATVVNNRYVTSHPLVLESELRISEKNSVLLYYNAPALVCTLRG
jgi:hypothetical protein